MHSLMLYNERDMSPIQYTKNINGMASLEECKTMDAATKQEVLERHNKNIVFVRMKL